MKPISGDEVEETYFREKSSAVRRSQPGFVTGYDFHPEARFDLDEIWESIRADDLDAAEQTIAEILSAIHSGA